MMPPQQQPPTPAFSSIQRDAAIRQLLLVTGSALGTYFAHKGLLSQDQVTLLGTVLPAAVGALMVLGGSIWTVISRKQANMVAAVAQMPEVNKVETTSTVDGKNLAIAANTAADPTGTVVAAK
jgi:hypothetical protein